LGLERSRFRDEFRIIISCLQTRARCKLVSVPYVGFVLSRRTENNTKTRRMKDEKKGEKNTNAGGLYQSSMVCSEDVEIEFGG